VFFNFKLVYDKTLVDQYNTANGTDFESYPAELLSFENEGVISIVPGDVTSESLNIVIQSTKNCFDCSKDCYTLLGRHHYFSVDTGAPCSS